MKNLKNLLLVAATALLFAATTTAQNATPPASGSQHEKIQALRIAFISQQLNLTPAEAQKFWPMYNQYQTDLHTLRENFKPGAGQQPTAEQQLDFEQKKLDLKKKYKTEFEGCLGKDKVNKLYGLEDEFRKKVQEYRDQKHGGGPGGRGPDGGGPGGPPPGGGQYGPPPGGGGNGGPGGPRPGGPR